MSKKYNIEEVKELLLKRNITLLDKEYYSNDKYLNLHCNKCNSNWKQKLRNILSGNGCPNCYGNKKYTYNFVKHFLDKKDIELLSGAYKNNREKLLLKCYLCKCQWQASFGNLKSGSGCPDCAKIKRKKTCLEKYGTDNPQKNKEIRNKTIETFKKRYGVEYPPKKKII